MFEISNYSLKYRVIIFFTLGAVIYVILGLISDFDQTYNEIKKIEPRIFAMILLLTLSNYALRILKWRLGTRSVSTIPLQRDIVVYVAGFLYSITPMKIGEVARAWMLNVEDPDVKISTGVSLSIVDRLSDIIALVLLAFLAAAIESSPKYLYFSVILLIGITFGSLLLFQQNFFNKLGNFITRFSRNLGSLILETGQSLQEYGYSKFLVIVLISIVSWSLEGIGLFIILDNLSINGSVWISILIFSLGSLIGAVSLLPGGIGGAEFSMLALFLALTNATTQAASGAIVIIRIATLWFGVFLGMFVYGYWSYTKN